MPTPTNAHSSTQTLVRYRCCQIDYCACGHLHLSVGPVTLRVEPSAAQALQHALTEALGTLRDEGMLNEIDLVGMVGESGHDRPSH